jgi:alpha-L-fucosidase
MEHTTHPDAQWFEGAGLGLFVHWGLSSVDASGELSWSMMARREGEKPAVEAYFDQADRWLAAARRAGAEYAVLTAKHHDGFAMWPSEYGEFGTAEYVDACRRHGLKVGLYFSLPDWHHDGWPANARETYEGLQAFTDATDLSYDPGDVAALEEYYQYVQGQLRELLTRYGDVVRPPPRRPRG